MSPVRYAHRLSLQAQHKALGTLQSLFDWRGFAAPDRPRLNRFGFAVATALIYFTLDELSYVYPLQSLNITPWSPDRSFVVALILFYGSAWVVWVYLTIFVAELVVSGARISLADAAVLAAALTCAYAVIAYLIRGPLRIRLELPRRSDVLRLALSIILGAVGASILYVGALLLIGDIEREAVRIAMFRFWIGDATGMLVTLPLLLMLFDARRRRELFALVQKPEIVLQLLVVVAALLLVFTRAEQDQSKDFYVLFLPMIWIAARHGLMGAIVGLLVVQVGIIMATTITLYGTLTVLELQTLLISLALTGLLLGATVDELRFASERLARTQQLTVASEMATAMAHELNQPLTALSTYADAMRAMVQSGDADSALVVDTAERIRQVATRSAGIVRQFRALGAPSIGKAEPVDLGRLIAAAVAELGERAAQEGVAVRVDVAGDVPPVRLDRERMLFVFCSLLANSMDAMRDRSGERRIEIAARRHGSAEVEIVVVDSGPGIPVHRVERIFQPFETDKVKAMGLALAVSRSIVESHCGSIWVESAGRGIFHIRLPL
jgi:two-component system, LuxR family, sensor kinase FixL